MKRYLLILTFFLAMVHCVAFAQEEENVVSTLQVPSSLQKVWAGKYRFKVGNDTLTMLVFNNITIYPPERFRNKDEEEFYWRTVRDVRRTLPYAKLISSTLLETYEYLGTYQNEKQKQDYMREFEKQIFNEYKPVMKKMTKNQGKMLIKLINRETNQNSYNIVKAFLGTFKAGFWQTFGRFFGANLKAGYHPTTNNEDAMVERICVRIEQGTL
ncbi:MAG: DUF4294 domain-containing protein [Muribaculaceae bacterium]|nr:DUF4294 domain-containing protein [Muribaculaceae bacterium]